MPSHVCGEMRADKLSQILTSGGENAKAAANRLFNRCLESGNADAKMTGIVLARACCDSEEMKRLMEKAENVGGIEPNTIMFTSLITTLMIEGDKFAAHRVVSEDMATAGLEPNKKTMEALGLPRRSISKMRAVKLAALVDSGDKESLAAAWRLFRKLIEIEEAAVPHFLTMTKACPDSGALCRLIYQDMLKSDVKPTMPLLTSFVRYLVLFGEYTKARQVLERGLPELGFVPTETQMQQIKLKKGYVELVMTKGDK